MIKKNWRTLVLTSIVTLIPIVVGLLLWNQLPEQMPTHWDINGEVDAWSGKGYAVFFFPALLLGLHWLCMLASTMDPKKENYTSRMLTLVLWICPAISLLVSSLMYTKALGYDLRVNVIMPLLMGLLFIIIGNLLPKMRQSYMIGIKLPWTLHNEENWNKTHRFGGKVWVAGGVIIMATAFVGSFWILLGMLIVMVALPTIYSYCLYRKQRSKEKE